MNPSNACAQYREEMMLLGLRKRLQEKDLTEEERHRLKAEIRELEANMDMT
jgi:hypothetical protein